MHHPYSNMFNKIPSDHINHSRSNHNNIQPAGIAHNYVPHVYTHPQVCYQPNLYPQRRPNPGYPSHRGISLLRDIDIAGERDKDYSLMPTSSLPSSGGLLKKLYDFD